MRHRALDYPADTPVGKLGLAALDDLLERGDLDDWAPLLKEVRSRPWGDVANRVLHLVDSHPMHGTSALWRAWITEQRAEVARPTTETFAAGPALRRLREQRGVTQSELARRLNMSQPEVSKLERRDDVRLSTARAYVKALGAELRLVAGFPDEDHGIV
jgi:DNA-binding transcriptional regulator YiaG